jgi:hypothetical protein
MFYNVKGTIGMMHNGKGTVGMMHNGKGAMGMMHNGNGKRGMMHNEKFHNFHCSPSTTSMVNSRTKYGVSGKMGDVYKNF